MKYKICFAAITLAVVAALIPSNTIHINASESIKGIKPTAPVLRPALVPICAAESSYEGTKYGKPRQFEPDGKTVRYGRVNHHDRGLCQINNVIHAIEIKRLGVDIETEAGNIAFANWLYDHEGTRPWNWSKGTWGK